MNYGGFHKAASALCYSLARQRFGGDVPYNDVVRFVLAQHGRMPDYMRFPLKCLTLLFDSAAILRTGRRFHKLPHEKRVRRIDAWRDSRIGPFRDLVRFFEVLVVFCCFSIAHD